MKKFLQNDWKRIAVGTLLLAVFIFSGDAFAQKKNKKTDKDPAVEQDTVSKSAATKNGIKPYSQVITSEAKTKEGLFTVHELDNKYYYEIPDSLLGRDMLLVTTIARTADGLGYGGERTNSFLVKWERNGDDILFRKISYNNSAADSLP